MQAAKDGYEGTWVDTCCIDKSSSAEFSEAINSMYAWYSPAPKKPFHVPLVEVDICLLAHQVGVSATDALDFGQGVHDLLLAIDVGVEETQLH